MKDGFIRIAAATPEVKVGDCKFNSDKIIDMIFAASRKNVSLIVFPELSITSYTCGDLFLRNDLINSSLFFLNEIIEKTKKLNVISIVGLPYNYLGALYNCAAVIYHGELLGLIPKKNIPNYSEFYEKRYFKEGIDNKKVFFNNKEIFFGTDIIFNCKNFPELRFGVEICEDLWVPKSPSVNLVSAGANLIFNLSASSESVGKANYRKDLVKMQSSKLICTYVYSSAGIGESSTDLVFSGHDIISENGTILSESKRFINGFIVADTDLQKIEFEKRKIQNSFLEEKKYSTVFFEIDKQELTLLRQFEKYPFVPKSHEKIEERSEEVLNLQANALATRLKNISVNKAILGLSGGLDSTLALLVTIKAFEILNLDKKGIIAITMPCFGTTSRTLNNAKKLSESYGISIKEIDIKSSVEKHFEDINQDKNNTDVVYENSQARERTQVLMDIANKEKGIVIGTGDLSELALGYATYNGDHMSMYSVNSSVPKTLIKYIVSYVAERSGENTKKVLQDILDTPISPELLPDQRTESIIGPYDLNDFFLYYFLRYGFSNKKILRLAKIAFKNIYDDNIIEKNLKMFIKRFFVSQFKRSCMPDGPKIGSATLSPRGDFRMPSDVSYKSFD